MDFRKKLPEPTAGRHVSNELDVLTREYRQFELDNIIHNVIKLKQSATDVQEAMAEVENYLQILKNIAKEVSLWKDGYYSFVCSMLFLYMYNSSNADMVIWMISVHSTLCISSVNNSLRTACQMWWSGWSLYIPHCVFTVLTLFCL